MNQKISVNYAAADSVEIQLDLDPATGVIKKVSYTAVSTLGILRWLKLATPGWIGRLPKDLPDGFLKDMPKGIKDSFTDINISQSARPQDRLLVNEILRKISEDWNLRYQDEELCHCRAVATHRVVRAIRLGNQNVEAIARTTSAGTSCGSCRPDSQGLLDDFRKGALQPK
jgi:bacterioferritin-associated ferredoxin